jgi:Protein of unknown function (DUF2799)
MLKTKGMKTLTSILFSFFAVLSVALISVGCSSMTKKECETANWENIGRYDGGQGKPLQEYELMKNQCEMYSRTPDQAAYLKGYKDGLERYCTNRNGEILGRSGAQYFEQCPENLRSEFLKGYRYGLSQFKAQMNRDRFEAYQLQKEDQARSLQ